MSTRSEVITSFINIIKAIEIEKSSLVLTLSKKMRKSSDLKSVKVQTILLKGVKVFKMVYTHDHKDLTKNFSFIDFITICEELLSHQFYNADLTINNDRYLLVSNKKNATIKQSLSAETALTKSHDKQKRRLIDKGAPYLRELGISSSNGEIYKSAQKKYKQINKYIEIIDNLCTDKNILSISDMGSGKGYLSFATYDHLSKLNPDITLTGYELRPILVENCNDIAKANHMEGLSFEVGDILNLELDNTDMIIALHACDIATDMAIAKGIKYDAKIIVVSPCCHKQIRKDMNGNTALANTLSHGIMKERIAEWVTDSIRALLLEAHGYKTKIMEFVSSEHTSKNLLITAEKSIPRPEAYEEIEYLKSQYGIKEHYLEKLLATN